MELFDAKWGRHTLVFCGFSHDPAAAWLASSLNGESTLAGMLILQGIGCCLDTLNR
jgi:hypothetical protein